MHSDAVSRPAVPDAAVPNPTVPLLVAAHRGAGAGRADAAVDTAMVRFADRGLPAELLVAADHATLERAARDRAAGGIRALVVVGGDGMVALGVNVAATAGVPLGVVPAGSGNDFARAAGLPRGDAGAAVDRIADALERGGLPGRLVDLAHAEGSFGARYVAGVLSAGFDAVVNERANRLRWPRERQRYNLALLLELAVFRPRDYTLLVDGSARRTRAMLVSVANGQFIGGGMRVVPHARLDDGALDLFVVGPLSRARLLAVFPRVFAGRHTGHPAVSFGRVRSVRIEAEGVTAYADGERLGPLPVTVEVRPSALRLLG